MSRREICPHCDSLITLTRDKTEAECPFCGKIVTFSSDAPVEKKKSKSHRLLNRPKSSRAKKDAPPSPSELLDDTKSSVLRPVVKNDASSTESRPIMTGRTSLQNAVKNAKTRSDTGRIKPTVSHNLEDTVFDLYRNEDGEIEVGEPAIAPDDLVSSDFPFLPMPPLPGIGAMEVKSRND